MNRNLCGYKVAKKTSQFIRGKKIQIPSTRHFQSMDILKNKKIVNDKIVEHVPLLKS